MTHTFKINHLKVDGLHLSVQIYISTVRPAISYSFLFMDLLSEKLMYVFKFLQPFILQSYLIKDKWLNSRPEYCIVYICKHSMYFNWSLIHKAARQMVSDTVAKQYLPMVHFTIHLVLQIIVYI